MFRTGTLALIVTSVLMLCVCGQRREDSIYRLLGDRLKTLELDYGEALSSVESARSKLKYKTGLQNSESATPLSATLLSTKCTTGQPLSGAPGPSHNIGENKEAMAAKAEGATNYQPPVKPDEPQYYVDDN